MDTDLHTPEKRERPGSENQTAVALEEVAFSYDGSSLVLRNLNVEIPRGQFVALIGGNGSGKSTLARLINALLLPDQGRVVVLGYPTNDPENTFAVRARAGMVFQNPDDQLVASVIENDVAFGPENLGIPSEEIGKRVGKALRVVGLQGFETHETAALSGGQKQRVAIAGILAMEPAVIVLDEASAMLDPRGRNGLMKVCQDLHSQGLTIIMITHFMEEAALADRIIALKDGAVLADGDPLEVLSNQSLLDLLSLEPPFAMRIRNALVLKGFDLPPVLFDSELVEVLSTRLLGGRQ